MPYIQIHTSARLSDGEKIELKTLALDAAAILGKKRSIVMVELQDSLALTRGDGEGDCAFCDVRVMGAADPAACNRFAETLSAGIARIAHTAPMSVYLSLSELSLCYTDGKLPPGH